MALRQPHYLRTRAGGITIGFLISVIKELKKKKKDKKGAPESKLLVFQTKSPGR